MAEPTILGTYVRALLGAVAARGVDANPLLACVGLCIDDLVDVDARVPLAKVKELWEEAARATSDADFGLRVGGAIEPRALGPLGFAVERSATVRDAFERTVRYNRIIDSGSFRVEIGEDLVWVRFRRGPCRQLAECSAASAVALARHITAHEQGSPSIVRFDHERPSDTTEHERFFACTPSFDCETTELAFDASLLDLPRTSGDAELAAFLDKSAEAILASLPAIEHAAELTRAELTRALFAGEIVTVERIAKRLEMSVRTLHRRLDGEGTTYTTLLDDTRYALARRLLREGVMSIDDIAFLVGFSETSAFSRAFRRWSGETARAFRQRG